MNVILKCIELLNKIVGDSTIKRVDRNFEGQLKLGTKIFEIFKVNSEEIKIKNSSIVKKYGTFVKKVGKTWLKDLKRIANNGSEPLAIFPLVNGKAKELIWPRGKPKGSFTNSA